MLSLPKVMPASWLSHDECCANDLQVAAYAGLDIAAKVFFGFFVMFSTPIVAKQQDREYKE